MQRLLSTNAIFSVLALLLQVLFILLFVFFAKYHRDADALTNSAAVNASSTGTKPENAALPLYFMMQDVSGMLFLGFGFLMVFLKRYGFGSVSFNMMIGVFGMQWAMLNNGFVQLATGDDSRFEIGVPQLIAAEFNAATLMISMGAVLGKTSALQLLVMVLIEIPIHIWAEHLGRHIFHATDPGDSIFVHMFGAYFGLACATILCTDAMKNHAREASRYNSDLFSMIGTLILWIFWPSFNAGTLPGEEQHRAIVNTLLSLMSCTMMTFVVNGLLPSENADGQEKTAVEQHRDNEYGKFNMVLMQNATLAGGVMIGACGNMMMKPFGALILGVVGGLVSCLGYRYLTPALNKVNIHDTCGVGNLHGMPGFMSGIASAILAALASLEVYGSTLYSVFPAMIPKQNKVFEYRTRFGGLTQVKADEGFGYTPQRQAGYQIAAIGATLGIAIVGGLLTGVLLRFVPGIGPRKEHELYADDPYWEIPVNEKQSEKPYQLMRGTELTQF